MAVVVSRYNRSITDKLLAGAIEAYVRRGGLAEHLRVVDAPGAYELPTLAHAAATLGTLRGVVALGCIIKGETSHDQHIAAAVAQGLVGVTLVTGVPCAFGVLTVDTPKQAQERAGGVHGNKGQEAMDAVLDTLEAIADLKAGPSGQRSRAGASGPGFGRGRRTIPDKAGLGKVRSMTGRRSGGGAR